MHIRDEHDNIIFQHDISMLITMTEDKNLRNLPRSPTFHKWPLNISAD